MGDVFPPLDSLAKAAKDRRDARRALRTATQSFAAELVKNLRRGDYVEVDSAAYLIENVTWFIEFGPPDDPFELMWHPTPEKAIVRRVGDRVIVLNDPRKRYTDDDGVVWRPSGDHVYFASVLDAVGADLPDPIEQPSESELLQFSEEAALVVESFTQLAAGDAEMFRSYAERLRGGTGNG